MSIDTLRLDRIKSASELIDPVFRNTPQISDESLSRRLGRETILKIETLNPVRSFKGRGVDFLLRDTAETRSVVCASAGNFGRAMAYVARQRGLTVRVYTSTNAVSAKVARMRELGARVVLEGDDFDAARDAAVAYASGREDCVLIEDGREPQIAEGSGTIALELAGLDLDTVVVPVGKGGLISGMARWFKAYSPGTRIIGVGASGAPAMAHSWRSGTPMATTTASTVADGVAVRVPVPEAVAWMRELVDDFVLVDDEQIFDGLRLLRDTVGLIVEPAGAAGIAALAHHDVPGARVATILSGSNFPPELVKSL